MLIITENKLRDNAEKVFPSSRENCGFIFMNNNNFTFKINS